MLVKFILPVLNQFNIPLSHRWNYQDLLNKLKHSGSCLNMDSQARGLYIDVVLLERLAELGKNNSLSVSALLNELITSYLEENDPQWLKNKDKRLFKRKRVMAGTLSKI